MLWFFHKLFISIKSWFCCYSLHTFSMLQRAFNLSLSFSPRVGSCYNPLILIPPFSHRMLLRLFPGGKRGRHPIDGHRRSNWFPQERNFKFGEVLSNWERDALLCSDVDKYFCKNTCENFSHNVSTWTDPSVTPTTFPDEIKVKRPVWFRNFVLLSLWRDGSCNEISFSKIQLVGSNSLKATAAAKEISHRRKGEKRKVKRSPFAFPPNAANELTDFWRLWDKSHMDTLISQLGISFTIA